MEFLSILRNAEVDVVGFLVPWLLIVMAAGFLAAWGLVYLMERTGWTRHVWHLPLFFIALTVICGSLFGFLLRP